MRKVWLLAVGLALLTMTIGQTAAAGSRERQARTVRGSNMALRRSVPMRPGTQARPSPLYLTSEIECDVTAPAGATNLNLDCDDKITPNNEPHIEVNPEDPLHLVASSNDYDSCCDGFYTSFDGGLTWQQGDMSAESFKRIGSDPVTTFDPVTDNVIHSSLNFLITGQGLADDGDVVVSISTDGGLTWGKPVVVDDGQGDDDDPLQIFHDKEWITTDTNPSSPYYGRTYLTWSRFVAESGRYRESAIYESHSSDGGLTWSAPQEINGSNALCTFQKDGPSGVCDQNQFSVPTVAPNGTIYVAFVSEQNESVWEPGEKFDDTYFVVKSVDGGATWSDPEKAVDLEDGKHDYPTSGLDRQTLSGLQIRVNAAGNIVAAPSGTLYLVFADNRGGTHDVPDPVTDTNVYLVSSSDGGATWSAPVGVDTSPGDQWFPWVDVNPVTGQLGIVYHDRIPGSALYDTSFATGSPGAFSITTLNTEPSNPRKAAHFRAEVAGCKKCTTFMGDYNSVAYGSNGVAYITWTDMRRLVHKNKGSLRGYTENILFATK